MSFNLKPKGDRVVIKKIDILHKTKSNILLVEQDNNKEYFVGEIIAMGQGKIIDHNGPLPLYCKVGERVLFKPQNALEFSWQGETYFVIRDNEVAFEAEFDENTIVNPNDYKSL